jgi:hypothetical protein
MIMTARAVALVLAVLTAGVATAADSDFTFTGSQFSIDKDVMECTSACVLKFKGPYRFSIGSAFPIGGNETKASNLRYFIGSSQFEIGNMLEMTSLPGGFVQLKAETIRMTPPPPAF